ncbi:hypothetical protein, partial [Akkermansia sp.]|uniref:hypothetical protein n=1 Tax=Akkermansia sp. TaxID=1872421 RepID=UPI00258DF4F0
PGTILMHRNVSQSLPNLCDGTNLDISSLIIADYFPAFSAEEKYNCLFQILSCFKQKKSKSSNLK